VIVSLHVATGAAGGALAGTRLRAAAVGALLHAVGDAIPHRDIDSRPFEITSGLALLGLLAGARGLLDPATVGAAAASAPDLEHVLPLRSPDGRKLFPSHRFEGWHQEGGLPAWLQLLAAGFIVGALLARR
jgi:hypothetical protein